MARGVKVPKNRWPGYYITRYQIRNLFKCDLGPDWRMTYTIIYEGAGFTVLELEVITHKEYNRRFGYKTT